MTTRAMQPLTLQGRLYLTANADRRVHLSRDRDSGSTLCGYSSAQTRPTTTSEARAQTFCPVCLAKAQTSAPSCDA